MASAQQDLLHVLAREHRDHTVAFHGLLDRAGASSARHRRRQFAGLVHHLGVHLTAERLLVHPLARAAMASGPQTVREREREIGSIWGRLVDAGRALDDPDALEDRLRTASRDVAAHADREELEVYTHVRHVATPKQLRHLGLLHVVLRQRLPTRYEREGAAPSEPWTDPDLPEHLRSWYAAELPDDEPVVVLDVTDEPAGRAPTRRRR